MALMYRNSYEDPETGEIVDVLEHVDDDDDDFDDDDDDDGDEFRNAGRRRAVPMPRGRGRGRDSRSRRRHPRPHHKPQTRPIYIRPNPPSQLIHRPKPDQMVINSPEHFAIKKSALVEFIPAAGKVWASFVGVPEAPQAVNDDVIDRNNAAMHREALARHSQSQTRILALSELAAKAIKVFTA